MQNILDKIKKHKLTEVIQAKKQFPIETILKSPKLADPCRSLSTKLIQSTKPQIIAEFKRQSPSKGIINKNADPNMIPIGYQNAGAAAISVLTDKDFFGADNEDFRIAREMVNIPILRKDFIIDPYQVYQTKIMGADVMLLIAAILSVEEVVELSKLAKKLGLEVLLELHDESELDRICEFIDMVGINNRNLKSFKVDTSQSASLIGKLPQNLPAIAESGLKNSDEVLNLFNSGFKGFLIGETFMKTDDPVGSCSEMIYNSQK